MDFADIADNPSEANELIFEPKHGFQITDEELLCQGGKDNVI